MKIAVVAANGREGQLIVKEAMERGHDVTAIVRGENKSVATNVVAKDALDLIAADLAGFDVVVNAVGAWTERLCRRSRTLPSIWPTCSPAPTCALSWSAARAAYS